MAIGEITNPYEFFTNADGTPLEAGQIYIGVDGLDPQDNPQAAYFDLAGTIGATQPIRTSGGYPVNAGSATKIFTDGSFSVKVLDENNNLVYSDLSVSQIVDDVDAVTLRVDGMTVPFDTVADFFAASIASIKKAANATTGTAYISIKKGLHSYSVDLAQSDDYEIVTPAGVEVTVVPLWAGASGGIYNLASYNLSGDISEDATSALTAAASVASIVRVPTGTFKVSTEVDWPSGVTFEGEGKGVSTLYFYQSSNPASSAFMLAARRSSNIAMRNLTVSTNALDDGLWDVGTYTAGPPKTYQDTYAGNINGLLISSCSNVTFTDVEFYGFNYHGCRISTEGGDPLTDYNNNVSFTRCNGHHCLVAPISGLGVRDFKLVNCTLTDNGHMTDDYIDGGAGYGAVLGRTTSASQLRSYGVIATGNFCARNVRRGLDLHAGGRVIIDSNIIEDALLNGISAQDIAGSADDTRVGNLTISNNSIYHTPWVEDKYDLITFIHPSTERPDSCPIFASQVGDALLKNITVSNNHVRGWRFRQIAANIAGTDTIGFVAGWATGSFKLIGNTFEQSDVNWLPSFGMNITADNLEVVGNSWVTAQRSTVSKAFWRWNATKEASFTANHFELQGVYTDQGTTQAAYPMFEEVGGVSSMDGGNTIIMPTQGTRGSLWSTSSANASWGFSGVLVSNTGNKLKLPDGSWVEYASRISGDLTVYVTQSGAGSGKFEGFSSAKAFRGNNAANFLNILNDLPSCDGGLTVVIEDGLDWGSDAGIELPKRHDNVLFVGDNSDNTNSMSKTGGIETTGNGPVIDCNGKNRNVTFEYLSLKSAGAQVLSNAQDVNYCAIEGTAAAGVGLYFQGGNHQVRNTRFKGAGGSSVAIQAREAGAVVSIANDSDASEFGYGLNANSATIFKNGTQPTGATANELAQNGGSIS